MPSGWHHAVFNVTDALSINQNWINAFNLHWTWTLIQQTTLHAQQQISDCREMCEEQEFEELVQRIVKAECGMGIDAFVQFLTYAVHQRTQFSLDLTLKEISPKARDSRLSRIQSVVTAVFHFASRPGVQSEVESCVEERPSPRCLTALSRLERQLRDFHDPPHR